MKEEAHRDILVSILYHPESDHMDIRGASLIEEDTSTSEVVTLETVLTILLQAGYLLEHKIITDKARENKHKLTLIRGGQEVTHVVPNKITP